MTITIKANIWWRYYFLPRKQKAIPAVIKTIAPLIIWYTDAAHWLNPTNISVEPKKSKAAGMASKKGLIEVFNPLDSAIWAPGDDGIVPSPSGSSYLFGKHLVLMKYKKRTVSSPANIMLPWKYGWLNFLPLANTVSSMNFITKVLAASNISMKSMMVYRPHALIYS